MKKVVKILGVIVAVVLVLGLGGFGWASMRTSSKLQQHFESHRVDVPIPYPIDGQDADPAAAMKNAVERGRHLVEARYGCQICHGTNFAGGVMIDDAAIGKLLAPNITGGKGSRNAAYTMADWDRIVRHGIKPDGTPAVMPSEDFLEMSDQELSDVVAFVKSHPPVDAEVDRPSFGPVGKVLVATGKFPMAAEQIPNHSAVHRARPPEATESVEFGAHMAAICTGCHRPNLAGGPMPFGPPDWPEAANLTADETGLKGWTFEDFEKVLTQGIRKNGAQVRDPMSLIVPAGQKMTPTERKAIWAYLQSRPPTPKNK